MLVNLCDYKQSVTLIANSGVQFLDFGLTPQDTASNGRFVRKTANGPLAPRFRPGQRALYPAGHERRAA
jgi:hypothetical protein